MSITGPYPDALYGQLITYNKKCVVEYDCRLLPLMLQVDFNYPKHINICKYDLLLFTYLRFPCTNNEELKGNKLEYTQLSHSHYVFLKK